MKELLLVIVLLLNTPLAVASVPVDADQPVSTCPKEKAQTVRSQDAVPARTNALPVTNSRGRGGSINGSRSATQRWNSFLPGMIR